MKYLIDSIVGFLLLIMALTISFAKDTTSMTDVKQIQNKIKQNEKLQEKKAQEFTNKLQNKINDDVSKQTNELYKNLPETSKEAIKVQQKENEIEKERLIKEGKEQAEAIQKEVKKIVDSYNF